MSTVVAIELREGAQTVHIGEVLVKLPGRVAQYYRHGWQSWSLAAWTAPEPLAVQEPRILHALQVDPFYADVQAPGGSWVGAVELEDGRVALLGAVGLEARVWLEDGCLRGICTEGEVEWLVFLGDEEAAFAAYVDRLGMVLGRGREVQAPRVWCSWYSLYRMIDEDILGRAFEGLGTLPFEVLQVDDGWQQDIGDWEVNAKFPGGMRAMAARIRAGGRKAGLWLAPLIVAQSSRLYREHADWLLRDEAGRLVSAGFNWGQPLYAIDSTHPEAGAWLEGLIHTVRGWGYEYLKLDFLYAGALPGKRYVDLPREAAFRQWLARTRAAARDAFLVTCGTPIVPSLGLCDAIRIGPDVSGVWEDGVNEGLLLNPSTPSSRNGIRTTLNRLWLGKVVLVDPDPVYFERLHQKLSGEQRQLLEDLAVVCNYRATSDLPQWWGVEEREGVRRFLNGGEQVRRRGRYVFEINGRLVDFSTAIGLPEVPVGWRKARRCVMRWVSNQGWVLQVYQWLEDRKHDRWRRGT